MSALQPGYRVAAPLSGICVLLERLKRWISGIPPLFRLSKPAAEPDSYPSFDAWVPTGC